jgi:hypothetical protein
MMPTLNCFTLLILLSCASVFAQNPFKKAVKKYRIDVSELVTSDESVRIFPRGFIYKLNEPDSVFYFGCFDSDLGTVREYFENKIQIKFPVNYSLSRMVGNFQEGISILSLQDLIRNFKTNDGLSFEMKGKDVNYLIIYYGSATDLDKDVIKNFKRIKEFSNNNPELGIQVLFVMANAK